MTNHERGPSWNPEIFIRPVNEAVDDEIGEVFLKDYADASAGRRELSE